MKILLACKSKMMENLGVMYLSSVVKKAGHESKIVTFDEVVHTARLWMPDIVGYSVMTGDQKKVIKVNGMLKNLWPSGKQKPMSIVGGPHATFFPADFENDDDINMIVKGEGEQVLADIIESGQQYSNIDSFPWPDRTDFPDMKIRDFISSRGCPYSCSYCYNDKWADMFSNLPRVRTRSVNDVVKEINSVSPEFVYFQDSCFGVSMKWLQEFSRKYKAEINIPFHAHLRPNQVDEERTILLSDAGCKSVRFALESASMRLRKALGRGKVDLVQVRQACRLLKKWDIKLMIQNILGVPTSAIEDDLETLEFNIKCRPSYGWCSIFVPYPGTKLGDQCVQEGWFKGDYEKITDCFFDESVLEFSDEYKEQVECLQKVFALCVEAEYLPEVKELTYNNFPKLIHKIMRRVGDKRLYGGAI